MFHQLQDRGFSRPRIDHPIPRKKLPWRSILRRLHPSPLQQVLPLVWPEHPEQLLSVLNVQSRPHPDVRTTELPFYSPHHSNPRKGSDNWQNQVFKQADCKSSINIPRDDPATKVLCRHVRHLLRQAQCGYSQHNCTHQCCWKIQATIQGKSHRRRKSCKKVRFCSRQTNAGVVRKYFPGQGPFRRWRLYFKLLRAGWFRAKWKFRTISSSHFLQNNLFKETSKQYQIQQQWNQKAKRQF